MPLLTHILSVYCGTPIGNPNNNPRGIYISFFFFFFHLSKKYKSLFLVYERITDFDKCQTIITNSVNDQRIYYRLRPAPSRALNFEFLVHVRTGDTIALDFERIYYTPRDLIFTPTNVRGYDSYRFGTRVDIVFESLFLTWFFFQNFLQMDVKYVEKIKWLLIKNVPNYLIQNYLYHSLFECQLVNAFLGYLNRIFSNFYII